MGIHLMDELCLFPLAEKDTGWCGEVELYDEFAQLVAGELFGKLLVEGYLGTILHIGLALHVLESLAPTGHQAIEDVASHEAVESGYMLLGMVDAFRSFTPFRMTKGVFRMTAIHAPQMVAEGGHTECADRRALIEAVQGTAAGLEHLIALLLAPGADVLVHPAHVYLLDATMLPVTLWQKYSKTLRSPVRDWQVLASLPVPLVP